MRALVLKNTLLLISLITSSIIQSPANADDAAGDILVKVTGLRNNNGVVRVALFNSSKSYADSSGDAEGAFQKVIAPIQGQEATTTLPNVPYGEYAIKCFHDEDNSGRFLTNKLGIPKVEYGFSNNAHGFFGPAPYDKAKFTLDKKRLDMAIKAQR
jgi:uncharacterized protein (DUF2141 family)